MNICLPKGIYYSNNILNTFNYEDKDIIIHNINIIKTYNGNNWNGYRLGDTISGKNHNLGPNLDKQIETIVNNWPNSLIHKYFLLKKYKNIKWNNFKELNKLLDEHESINFSKFDNNYIAMHLRVGDGISWRTPFEAYNNDFFENIEKRTKIKDIIIFCGSHNCRGRPNALVINYIKQVINILNKRGYNVIIRSGNSPDDDLFLMVKATHFISGGLSNKIKPGGGGYCGLVRVLRRNLNHLKI